MFHSQRSRCISCIHQQYSVRWALKFVSWFVFSFEYSKHINRLWNNLLERERSESSENEWKQIHFLHRRSTHNWSRKFLNENAMSDRRQKRERKIILRQSVVFLSFYCCFFDCLFCVLSFEEKRLLLTSLRSKISIRMSINSKTTRHVKFIQ